VTDGTLRKKVVLGAVAAAALVGGGSAIAAGQLGSDANQQAILNDAAESSESVARGVAWGQTVADAIWTWRSNDGFGTPTKTELLTDNRLTLDLGKLASNRPDLVDVFVGYRYWQNKFGSDHTLDLTGGSTESTAYLGMALHMPK